MENNLEKKLELLLALQKIDKQVNEIIKMRGDLPNEVAELENAVPVIQATLQQDQQDIVDLEDTITTQRLRQKNSLLLIQRYEEQQMNVRNNREYDAITKAMESQRLNIQLTENKIKECHKQIEQKKIMIAQNSVTIEQKKQAIVDKKKELKGVIKDSEKEEENLYQQREKLIKKIDQNLLQLYEEIRKNSRNNLAVVVIRKGACSGCFILLHPQIQAEVRLHQEIMRCEHCARIIADVVDITTTTEEKNIEEPESLYT